MNEFLKITKLAWAYLSRDPLQIIKIFFVPAFFVFASLLTRGIAKPVSVVFAVLFFLAIFNAIVIFHRLSILGERMEGWVPNANFGLSSLYLLNLIVASFFASFAAAPFMLIYINFSYSIWPVIIVFSAYYWAMARIAPFLVGGAIGRVVGVRDAWRSTKPASLAFAMLAIIYISVEIMLLYLPEAFNYLFYAFYALYSLAVITASYRLYCITDKQENE